jgi:hypothetical protein
MPDDTESAQQVVARAIALAGEAVQADQRGDAEGAVQLYQESVDLISFGLALQDEEEADGAEPLDTAQLLEFSQVYCDRIEVLTVGSGGGGGGYINSSAAAA